MVVGRLALPLLSRFVVIRRHVVTRDLQRLRLIQCKFGQSPTTEHYDASGEKVPKFIYINASPPDRPRDGPQITLRLILVIAYQFDVLDAACTPLTFLCALNLGG